MKTALFSALAILVTIPYTVSGGESMVRFYIVRHGQTRKRCSSSQPTCHILHENCVVFCLHTSQDRAQGWADSPLTEAGKQMAADIGQKLKGIDFDAVYTSDMLRAVQTAELILKTNGKSWLFITIYPAPMRKPRFQMRAGKLMRSLPSALCLTAPAQINGLLSL